MRPLLLVAGLVALPTLALATTLIPHTLSQRAEQSDRVAMVQVIDQKVEERPGEQFPIKTYTRVVVGRDLKGRGPSELTIVQLGGTVGATTMKIPGDAEFRVGETAVVFLRCQVAADRCHLVAFSSGKLQMDGEDVFVQDLATKQWSKRKLASLQAELGGQPAVKP